MNIKKITSVWASIALLMAPVVHAGNVNWSGFATISGGVRTSGEKIPDGLKTAESETLLLYGYDDKPSFEKDSHIGLQANADLGKGVTAVTQIIARGENDWEPTVEWAYIGYQATDNLKLLFGRQRIPYFNYSDFLDVSYAYHWITPPEEVYGSVPFDSANGIGIIYSNMIGAVDSRLHFLYGRSEQDIDILGQKQSSDINIMSLSWTLDYEWLNVRTGYTSADIDYTYPDLERLSNGWAGLGAAAGTTEWAGFSDYILPNDGNNTGDFTDAAITINRNGFLFIAEYGKLGTDGAATGDIEGMYASLGYQVGNLTPHITYGISEGTASDTDFLNGVREQLSSGGVPAIPIDADGTLLTQAVGGAILGTEQAFGAAISKEKYWSIGLRWDFHPSLSLKAEYKTISDDLSNDDNKSLVRFALVSVF